MPDLSLSLLALLPWRTAALAFLVAAIAIALLHPVGRRIGWVDKPSGRKHHQGEIPLVGGWAIMLAILVSVAIGGLASAAPLGYWVGALLLFTVSAFDDRYPVRARYRFAAQVVAAIAGISMGGQALLDLGDLLGTGPLTQWWLVLPVSVLGSVAVINAVNFTDGADGLCGGLCFVGTFWFLVALCIAAESSANGTVPAPYAGSLFQLTAAALGGLGGFLLFNMRSPWRATAAVFMGDSGSMLMGFTMAWTAIHVTTAFGVPSVSPVACLWILAVPLMDLASCIVRRTLAGVTPMTPDTKHLHHLTRRMGLSVSESVLVIHVGAFLLGLVGVVGWWLRIQEQLMFGLFITAVAAYVAVTNLLWRQIERREAMALTA